MLINLWLNPKNNDLKFDLPPVLFKEGQKICVSRLFIEWNSSVKLTPLILYSTIIEKSPTNPHQQLFFATPSATNKRVFVSDYTPTHKTYYKIQCLDLQSSEFALRDLNNNKIPTIKRIFVQLEIDERVYYFFI